MPNLVRSIMDRFSSSPEGADPAVFKALKTALAPLDKIEGGLGKRAATYVCTGEGAAVLLTLQKHAAKVLERLDPHQDRSYERKGPWPLADILDDDSYWDPEVILRLGKVYGTMESAFGGGDYGFCGTKAAPMWLRMLLSITEHARREVEGYGKELRRCFGGLTVARCRELLRLAEAPDDGLLDIVFHRSATQYQQGHCVDKLPGVEDYLRAEPETVVAAAQGLDATGRVELLRAIGRFGLTGAYLDYVFVQGTGSAKSAREAALAALHGADAKQLLAKAAEIFETGSAGARGHTASLIASALKETARPLLEAQLEQEKGKRVRETIEAALITLSLTDEDARREGEASSASGPWSGSTEGDATPEPANGGFVALDGTPVDLPPRPPLPEKTRIPDQAFDPLRNAIKSYNQGLEAFKRANTGERYHWSQRMDPMTEDELKAFGRALQGEQTKRDKARQRAHLHQLNWEQSGFKYDRSGVDAFYASADVTVRHLVTLIRSTNSYWTLFDCVSEERSYSQGYLPAQRVRHHLRAGLDFRTVAALWRDAGQREPLREYLTKEYLRDLGETEIDGLWIYCAEHLDLIDEALGLTPQSGDKPLITMAALEILERFPKVPKRYLMPLMGLAAGSRKTLRVPARKLLAGAPQIDGAIAALLRDSKQEVRAGAADWLAERGAKDQTAALRAAVDKERSEVARAAMLTALERLGEDVSGYFDPKTLLAEAEAGLKKVKPKALDWFPHDAVPNVRWRDGTPLDPRIVAWWIALADKLKQPGGNALLDLYLDRLAPEDSARLGLFSLRTWIARDTLRVSDTEANAYAQANVDATYKSWLRWDRSLTKDSVFARLKSEKLGEYLTSANADKGLLGLATQVPGPDAAEAVRAYLRNHGARIAQCKALLECLAANPSPAAIQIVLATANRFKAKTVQAHAQALIEDIAERRGWTADQLADRTVPTGGLDEAGVLELDCGDERVYRAKLADDGKLILENPGGKEVKALPGARNDEEQSLIKAAKKALSGARKEIKQVNAMQTTRLFEAMCLERTWAPQEWQQHLVRHPLVGRMCQRLVWLGLDGNGGVAASFRPLDDGSLSDPEDGTVTLGGVAAIKLAHQTLMPAATKEAWLAHLKDYEIEPLFDQFSRPLLKPGDEEAKSDEISDRTGYMLDSFKLRGAATKLGYERGAAEDGGVFMDYAKRFEGAGVAVVIEFTGSPLPEENIACALRSLKFYRIRKKASYWGSSLSLGAVSPVLLSESWNDYHQIAAAGTGFDPAWEKKAEYW